MPALSLARYSATAVNNTSELELIAVSQESWITPITKPTPTTCIAISLLIPKSEHASGISNKEPPATPEAPQAEIADKTERMTAVGISTEIPSAQHVDIVMTEIVTAAPAILMVAPSGIETE